MTNPGEILPDEIEGIDYIKTYYKVAVVSCPSCEKLDFTVCETKELSLKEDECKPFYFDTIKLKIPDVPANEDDPNDHCIYSESHCQAEIIKFGKDEKGHYFLWKAYTEWPDPASKSGLGYMLMFAFIKNQGQDLCRSRLTVIQVDCCEKPDLLPPEIYWECGIWTPCESPPVQKFGTEIGQTPDLISYLTLSDCTALTGTCEFFAIPEVGGCYPYKWVLSGPGSLEIPNPLGMEAIYHGDPDYEGCEDFTITVKDRCGGEDAITISCCQFASPLSIDYTTLQMACNGVQTFFPVGGCSPYNWVVSSGGGSITQDGVYTAPSSNANCGSNATITLTDCCGGSASIQIAVNCYNPSYDAFVGYGWRDTGPWGVCGSSAPHLWYYDQYIYRCDGSLRVYNPEVDNMWIPSGMSTSNLGWLILAA
jgi:hypothetical protein